MVAAGSTSIYQNLPAIIYCNCISVNNCLLIFYSLPHSQYLLILQNFTDSDSTSKTLKLLEKLNEVITSSQDELDFFYESGGLKLILKLFSTDNKLDCICLKILLNASKKNDKLREELLKSNIFHLLTIKLKQESHFSRSLVLYAALIIVLVHGNDVSQDQIRTSGCLSYLVYILDTILVDIERTPLLLKNTELLVYSIITCNKDPRNLENQTEVGWITPKVVEYLGKQTIFSGSDEIHVVKCFWSFLKTILHRNEFNQQIFLKCSGFVVLFRSMQEIVDEKKTEEFGSLLIKMTGVLVRLKSQKEFLHLASSYCSLMILRSLLNTCNAWIVQHVITFLDSLTQEIPYVLQPAGDKQILQCLIRAKIILSESKMSTELCQSIWERTVLYPNISHVYTTVTSDKTFISHTSSVPGYSKNQFCNIHDSNALQMSQFQSDYFFDTYSPKEFPEQSKLNESRHLDIWTTQLRKKVKERKTLKMGQINRNESKKSITRITVRKIIQFFGKLQSFFS